MGSEFGQWQEWSEQRSLDWPLLEGHHHRGLQQCVADLNRAYQHNPALWLKDHDPAGFEWIDANDAVGNVFSWLRFDDADGIVACVVNMAPVVHYDYRIGLPRPGRWIEMLNTDAGVYGRIRCRQPGWCHRGRPGVAWPTGVGSDGPGPDWQRSGCAGRDGTLRSASRRVRSLRFDALGG